MTTVDTEDGAPEPPERLETPRLVLRPSRPDDAFVHHRLWTERDPRVPAHRRLDADGRPSVADLAAELAAQGDRSGLRLLTVELRATQEVIGYCGLLTTGRGSPTTPELAYELLRSAHGCGYATEAAQAVVDWARVFGCPQLWAGVWDWNLASRRVLAKLGFTEVGRVEPTSIHGHSLLYVREL